MKHTTLKIAGMALAIAATALVARADIALNQNVSLYGYAAGFIEYNQYASGDNSSTGMDLRAVRLGTAFNFAPVTAKISTYYTGNEFYLLDANVTYDLGQGMSLTGGRFLSKFGYEPFDIPSGFFITGGGSPFGDISPLALLPNFHEGLRFEYAINKENTVGISLVDSLFNGVDGSGNVTPFRGDGKLSDGYGIEAYYRLLHGPLSLGATLAYQNTRPTNNAYRTTALANTYVGDIWAQYIIKDTLLAAEFAYRGDTDNENFGTKIVNQTMYYGLVTVKQQINDKFSLAGRFTYGNYKEDYPGASSLNFWKLSVTPAYAITKNLSVAAEVNYTKYNEKILGSTGKDNKVYAGVQACFSF